jgi:hypothetical protein
MEEELNFLLIMLHQTNLLIEAFFPDSNFRVAGTHSGEKFIQGDDSGKLEKNQLLIEKVK